MTVSDQMLAAYVDGELGPDAERVVRAALRDDPALSMREAAHRQLRDRIGAAFSEIPSEPVPERLLRAAMADTVRPSKVVAFRPRSAPFRSTWLLPAGGALAAGLALGAVLSPALSPPSAQAWIGRDMTAQAGLAQALDSQLASAQGPGPIRIGVSFRATDGRMCRTFEAQGAGGVTGLACRRPAAGWTVRMAVPGEAAETGAYRTAASPLAKPVAELAQSLEAGPPLGRDEEMAARTAGWR